jgi:DNA-binding CsgD family transcriptional regulator
MDRQADMSKLKTHADISNEMIVHRHGNGVIIKPPEANGEKNLSIGDVLALPINVYILNVNSQNCAVNDIVVDVCGWSSVKGSLGKSIDSIWPDKLATPTLGNDRSVVTTNKMKVIEEEVFNEKITGLQALTFKFPWYDVKGKIVGVFGCSMVPDCYPFYSLGNSLAILAKTGLLDTNKSEAPLGVPIFSENYFTKREMDVLKLLIRAKTSKEIATHLGLSHRTVEHYLENAKRKVGVSSKSELIDKIITSNY